MRFKQLIYRIICTLPFGIIPSAFADNDSSLGDIASNLFDVAKSVHGILQAILIIAGTALLLGSLLQYKKHRENPIETKLSTVIFVFILGVFLIVLAFIPMQIFSDNPTP